MGLRFILVSVVAALGLTLPSGSQVVSWKASAQSWLNARLAEWDARMPVDEKAFVYATDAAPLSAEVASSAAAVTAPRPVESPAPAPGTAPAVSAPETRAEAIAGLDLPTVPTALDEFEFELGPPAVAELVPTVSVSDAAFVSAQEQSLMAFAADAHSLDVFEDIERVEVARTETTAAPLPAPDSVESFQDLYGGVAYALNREAEGLSLPAPSPARTPGPVSQAGAAGESENLYGGVAFALNREAEGLNLTPDVSPKDDARRPRLAETRDETEPQASRLVHAVRLTREAVYAWANLLHGPAVVTINH